MECTNLASDIQKPLLCVYKSLTQTYAQLISDESGKVIGAVSSKKVGAKAHKEGAKVVGEKIAQIAKEKSISEVVFDRNGYIYHGRVAAVADGAREGGLSL